MSEPVEFTDQNAFTASEERLAQSIRDAGERSNDLAAVGVALAGGFILYRLWMLRRLREETKDRVVEPHTLYELNSRLFAKFSTRFALTLAPALISGYRIGLAEAKTMPLSDEWLRSSANGYARALAGHINETSSEALVEGFQAQLNRRIAARVALDRSIDAFGVAPRTMKSLVNLWVAPPVKGGEKTLTSRSTTNKVKDRADRMIAQALIQRGKDIGDTESYASKNQSKSLIWMYLQQRGDLPKDATKMWRTARDERVCPVCGPLHKVQIPLSEQFTLPGGGKVWAPGVHPRCRCDIVLRGAANIVTDASQFLVEEEPRVLVAKSAWGVVEKARGDDPFARDRNGRFAPTEQRGARFAEPEQDVRLSDLIKMPPPEEKIRPTERIKAGSQIKPTERIKPQERISTGSVAPQRVSAERPKAGGRISAGGGVRVSRSKIPANQKRDINAKLDSVFQAKFKRDIGLPKVEFKGTPKEATDTWTVTPDGRPMFGIFGAASFHGSKAEMLMSDDETEWYTSGTSGRGIPTLQQGVANYWKNEVLGKDALDRSFQAFASEIGTANDGDREMLIIPTDDGEYYLNRDDFEAAMKTAVYGLSPHEAPQITTQAAFAHWDPETEEYEFDEEDDAYMVSLYQVANDLGLDNYVEQHIPLVGVSRYIRTDADGYWGGIMTNNGKWRVTQHEATNRAPWSARDSQDEFPYDLVVVEPDDLFD